MLKQLLSHFRRSADDDQQNPVSARLPHDEVANPATASLDNGSRSTNAADPSRIDGLQIASHFCDLLFGEVISGDAEYSTAERQLLDRMECLSAADILRSAALPRLPAIIPQILASLHDPEVSHG